MGKEGGRLGEGGLEADIFRGLLEYCGNGMRLYMRISWRLREPLSDGT